MRVTMVISALSAGGAERVLASLANHWIEQGHAVTLITFDNANPYYPLNDAVNLQQLNLPTSGLPRSRAFANTLQRIFRLRQSIKQSRPDLVISFLSKINVLTLLATRGMSIPVVVSERNNPDRQKLRTVWQFARRRLYALADRLVTPSQGILDCFSDRLRARGQVIPNPVDIPKGMRPRKPTAQGFIAVGRLVDQKGFDLLLHAYRNVASDFPEWPLKIRGDGHLRREIELLRDELGLKDKVSLPGCTESPGTWVHEGEIFVLSSRYEGFANVLTEAMVAGLPIISFDCPFGPRDIITNGVDGILVSPEDTGQLAEAMATAIRDADLRHRLSQAALQNIRRFERSRVMRLWDKLAADLVATSDVTGA